MRTSDVAFFEDFKRALEQRWVELIDSVQISLRPFEKGAFAAMSAIAEASIKSVEALPRVIQQMNVVEKNIAGTVARAFESLRVPLLQFEALRSAIPSALLSINREQVHAFAEIVASLQKSVPRTDFFDDLTRLASYCLYSDGGGASFPW